VGQNNDKEIRKAKKERNQKYRDLS